MSTILSGIAGVGPFGSILFVYTSKQYKICIQFVCNFVYSSELPMIKFIALTFQQGHGNQSPNFTDIILN